MTLRGIGPLSSSAGGSVPAETLIAAAGAIRRGVFSRRSGLFAVPPPRAYEL